MKLLDLTKPVKSPLKKWGNVLTVLGIVFLWTSIVQIIFNVFFPQSPYPQSDDIPHNLWDTIRLGIWAMVFAPVIEEFVYRWIGCNYMIHNKWDNMNRWFGILFLGVMFAFWHHQSYYALLVQGVGGVLLGWLYMKNRSLKMNMLTHAVINFFLTWGVYWLNRY